MTPLFKIPLVNHRDVDLAMSHKKFDERVKILLFPRRLRKLLQQRAFKKILFCSIFLILLNCILLDSTGFFIHFSIYITTIGAITFVNERVIFWIVQIKPAKKFVRENARLVLTLIWMLMSTLLPFPSGLIRLLITSGTVITTLGLIYTCLIPGAIAVAICSIIFITLGLSSGLSLGFIICVLFSMNTILIVWLRRSLLINIDENASIPLIQGTLLTMVTLVIVPFVTICIFLSINSFWIHSNEISKFELLQRLGDVSSLHTTRIESISDIQQWNIKGGTFPVIIKPNICTTNSAGVRLCHDLNCLIQYVEERKEIEFRQNYTSWIIQDAANGKEVVVFFFRYPYYKKGFVKSVGIRKKAKLLNISMSNGNDLQASYSTKDVNYLATPQFVQFFNDLTENFTGYTGGRFDVIIANLKLAMATGTGIHVLEGNIFPLGDIEEKAAGISMKIRAIRTMMLQIWMGFITLLGGYQSDVIVLLTNMSRLVKRYYQCHNHENLYGVP
ncbi:hypothetical protein I4U23_011741 [Adineta vaga]|nr:hypothetical protein I4U23_011741 [Adineta vaga]